MASRRPHVIGRMLQSVKQPLDNAGTALPACLNATVARVTWIRFGYDERQHHRNAT
eukprot:m.96614 g.96614  ORF g.96614 m.96614 type:complete len:56 (-) comp16666_c0_seq7:909-1076(-)